MEGVRCCRTYMDVHQWVEGFTAQAVAEAHQRDLEVQGKYGVSYQRYWFDEGTGRVFCRVEVPSKETAIASTEGPRPGGQ
jgi:hypothetical protein